MVSILLVLRFIPVLSCFALYYSGAPPKNYTCQALLTIGFQQIQTRESVEGDLRAGKQAQSVPLSSFLSWIQQCLCRGQGQCHGSKFLPGSVPNSRGVVPSPEKPRPSFVLQPQERYCLLYINLWVILSSCLSLQLSKHFCNQCLILNFAVVLLGLVIIFFSKLQLIHMH